MKAIFHHQLEVLRVQVYLVHQPAFVVLKKAQFHLSIVSFVPL
jgi:hypothetical protein